MAHLRPGELEDIHGTDGFDQRLRVKMVMLFFESAFRRARFHLLLNISVDEPEAWLLTRGSPSVLKPVARYRIRLRLHTGREVLGLVDVRHPSAADQPRFWVEQPSTWPVRWDYSDVDGGVAIVRAAELRATCTDWKSPRLSANVVTSYHYRSKMKRDGHRAYIRRGWPTAITIGY